MLLDTYKPLFHVGYALFNGQYEKYKGYIIPFKLNPGSEIDIGIDQSTDQTGVAVFKHAGPLIGVFDLMNKSLPSKEIYVELVMRFFQEFTDGLKVVNVVYENPVDKSKTQYTRNILLELRGHIKSMQVRIPAFETATITEISISTWRAHFLASDKYKGRKRRTEDVKCAAEEESCARFPFLVDYADIYGKPPDSMDAVGIYCGFKEEVFTDAEMTRRRVNRTMFPINNLGYSAELVRVPLTSIKECLKAKFGSVVCTRGYEVMAYNSDFTWQNNALRACSVSNAFVVITVTNPKDIQAIRWDVGEDLEAGEIYAILCYRKNLDPKIPIIPRTGEEVFWGVCGAV